MSSLFLSLTCLVFLQENTVFKSFLTLLLELVFKIPKISLKFKSCSLHVFAIFLKIELLLLNILVITVIDRL